MSEIVNKHLESYDIFDGIEGQNDNAYIPKNSRKKVRYENDAIYGNRLVNEAVEVGNENNPYTGYVLIAIINE